MTQTVKPYVKLCLVNTYYYNCGMLVVTSVDLPNDEAVLKEKLKEIEADGGDGYTVLRGETQIKCTIPETLDIFDLNQKMKRLTDKDMETLKILSEAGRSSLVNLVDQVLEKSYKIYENVTTEEELGRKLFQEGLLPFRIPVYLVDYIDFEKLGHEACVNESIHIIPKMKLAEKLCG